VQLDRVPPPPAGDIPANPPDLGVCTGEASAAAEWTLRRRPVRWTGWLACAGMVLLLLGAGEPRKADSRFRSPSTTLETYWQALRHDDHFTAEDCLLEPSLDLPTPGMLWFLPPTTSLRIANLRSLPVENGRVMATYEVRFVPLGGGGEQVFRTAAELVRVRGEWRIGRPIGEVSLPEWKPIPRTVDI